MTKKSNHIAVVVSQFNKEVTDGLLYGAKSYLQEQGVTAEELSIYQAPGAFEIPLIAQKLAKSERFSGVICLGAIIKGETAHFEFLSLGATTGIMQTMLATGIPITFGILTTYTEEQAQSRSAITSRDLANNKGREAAAACWQTIQTLERI